MIETKLPAEKAVLVGLIYKTRMKSRPANTSKNLEFLADTAGAEVLKKFTQKLSVPFVSTFVGPGNWRRNLPTLR
jgi:GTPase